MESEEARGREGKGQGPKTEGEERRKREQEGEQEGLGGHETAMGRVQERNGGRKG